MKLDKLNMLGIALVISLAAVGFSQHYSTSNNDEWRAFLVRQQALENYWRVEFGHSIYQGLTIPLTLAQIHSLQFANLMGYKPDGPTDIYKLTKVRIQHVQGYDHAVVVTLIDVKGKAVILWLDGNIDPNEDNAEGTTRNIKDIDSAGN